MPKDFAQGKDLKRRIEAALHAILKDYPELFKGFSLVESLFEERQEHGIAFKVSLFPQTLGVSTKKPRSPEAEVDRLKSLLGKVIASLEQYREDDGAFSSMGAVSVKTLLAEMKAALEG